MNLTEIETLPKIPVNALFDGTGNFGPNRNNKYPDFLKSADMIFAVDWEIKQPFVVYGRDRLEGIENESKDLNSVLVEIDHNTDELERLISLVRILKGTDSSSSTDRPSGIQA